MFGFGKKKEDIQQEQIVTKPFLLIEIEEDKSLSIGINWPDSKDNDEAVDMGRLIAGFLYVLTTREVLPGIMKAVILNGERNAQHRVTASAIATILNKAVTGKDKTLGMPIIKPTEVFQRKIKDEE